ncbi:MAG: hypothetical protein VX906_04215, partial [Candidatus Thermoplasmatota archaeon]|nr:hypothetical protein [Candidatus Thermoplasmatota archaeon]
IGITHAGDGCSRRITDFDREQAIEIGDAAHAELEAANATLEKKAELTKDLPNPSNMELAPDELPAPASLGGSLLDGVVVAPEDEAGDQTAEPPEEESVVADESISSLADRAADEKEDMDERNEWQEKVDAAEAEEENQVTPDPHLEESPEIEEQE